LVKYEILGFKNENEYLDYFFKTLLKTNQTYEYFVDWMKVKEKIRKYVKEISILNSLTKIESEKRKEELKEIFIKYPETIPIIPSIIAVRERSITLLEIWEKALYKTFNFSERKIEENEVEELVDFCEKVGILQLFGEINDLYAYLLGVEVGLDSNARKNRSGKIFQKFVKLLLRRKLKDLNIEIKSEDSSIRTIRRKKADFVIYMKNNPRIIIECNFYNVSGSKPIETANAYIDLQHKIYEKEAFFIWITDGPAWNKMRKTIIQSFKEIDFPTNYTIANEKINELILKLL
jgi:type II restriction enzyme